MATTWVAAMIVAIWAIGSIPSMLAIEFGTTVEDATLYPFFIMIGNPHMCGGAVLNLDPPRVLTAAHCVADSPTPSTLSKNPYFVSFGDTDRHRMQSAMIVDWVVHPNYDMGNNNTDMHHDMAILFLDKPLDGVERVALWPPDRDLPNSTRGALMGFGYTGPTSPEATVLQRTTLDITLFQRNTTEMVEAMTSGNDTAMACHGDSGSPLVVHVSADKSEPSGASPHRVLVPFVVGTLARIFGVHDPDPTKPTCPERQPHTNTIESFTNVGSALPWIVQHTNLTLAQLTDPFYGNDRARLNGRFQSFSGWHIAMSSNAFAQPSQFHIGPVVESYFTSASAPQVAMPRTFLYLIMAAPLITIVFQRYHHAMNHP